MTLVSAIILLFFVMDPLGNIPLFLSTLRDVPPERRRPIIVRELFFALLILLAFLFGGTFLLDALHVSEQALTTAGGIVLMLIAIRMIFPTSTHSLHEKVISEPFIFPLAVPYTAGPSAMATELLLMSREPHRWHIWVIAVFVAWLASAIILFFAGNFQKLLGDRGLTALERLMGMLLVTVAVQMIMEGIAQYLRSPATP